MIMFWDAALLTRFGLSFSNLYCHILYQIIKEWLTASRLDAQHLLWKLHKGYELHPTIPITSDMKIAEVGTGTGWVVIFSLQRYLSSPKWLQTSNSVWIFDVARQLPPSVHLFGFDISNAQFPPKKLWPQNVSLGVLNSLAKPPPSLAGQFDVVHLRMWASNLRGKDTSILISHAKSLLSMSYFNQQLEFAKCYWRSYRAWRVHSMGGSRLGTSACGRAQSRRIWAANQRNIWKSRPRLQVSYHSIVCYQSCLLNLCDNVAGCLV